MVITLIRHFPTPGNLQKRYIGRTDEELDTEFLMSNIWRYRGLYEPRGILYVSPMVRCRQTASVLFPGQKMQVCADLRETDFGIFEGKTYEELCEVPAYQAWLDSNGTGVIPDGESQEQFRQRCLAGFDRLVVQASEDQAASAAVIVHGGVIMALLAAYGDEDKDFYDWQVKNGCGYRVHLDADQWMQGIKKFYQIEKIEVV